jgi:hypothetical protein
MGPVQTGQYLALAAQIPAKQKSRCRPLHVVRRASWQASHVRAMRYIYIPRL